MMTSLFSIFDPTAALNMPLNWLILSVIPLFMPLVFWKKNSRVVKIFNIIPMLINKEFTSLFMKNILLKGTTFLPVALFMFIMINNLSSNFPYTFCSAAHLSFSLTLSIPIWSAIVIFCWMNLTKTMFSHLVPQSTPGLLMPLMVMIELTSNLIRPLALAVRLTANLIAGHLLMVLLGENLDPTTYYWMVILMLQTMFLLFELMVALIQSYVFSVLITLYSSEIS